MSILLPTRRALNVGAWAKNSLWKTAKSVPSLDLRFAENKSLVDSVSGQNLITFTRASSGTYVGSDGLIKTAAVNEPRFDHDPTTGESLGLLVEESRSNLLTYSEQFDNANWVTSGASITSNVILAPDGSLTADKLVEDTSTGSHSAKQTASIISGSTYTVSVFVKSAERTLVEVWLLSFSQTVGAGIRVDLTNGSFVSSRAVGGSTLSGYTITSIKNGWYKITVTVIQNSTTGGLSVFLMAPGTPTNTTSYTGNGTSGIYIWGAQLEAGSFPTSYIPTSGSTVTRSADVASITGANFTSWYRQDEGTIFCSAASPLTPGSQVVAQVINGTTAFERIVFTRTANSNTAGLTVNASGTNQANISAANAFIANAARLSTAYRQDDIAFVANGGSVSIDTSALIPTVNKLELGQFTSAAPLNGTISRLTYWQSRLPDSILQNLT